MVRQMVAETDPHSSRQFSVSLYPYRPRIRTARVRLLPLNPASLEDQHAQEAEQSKQNAPRTLWVQGVSKTFATSKKMVEALHPVDLEIATGEFVCFLGPSGCGKSTLLSIIAGLEKASDGTVLANEKEVQGPGTDRILLFQEAALFPWLNVQQNVEFGLQQRGVPRQKRKEIAQKS